MREKFEKAVTERRLPLAGALLVITAALVPGAARTATASDGDDGFSLRLPFRVELRRETSAGTEPASGERSALSETFWLVHPPAMSFGASGPRGAFFVDYQPELTLGRETATLRDLNHYASLRFDYSLTRRLAFAAGDVFNDVDDPSRYLRQPSFLTNGGSYRDNASWLELGYSWTRRSTLALRLDTIQSRAETSGGDALLDSRTLAGTLRFSRAVSRHQGLTLRWSVLGSIRRVASPLYTHSVDVSYRVAPDRGFETEISGGVIAGDGATYALSARTEKAVGPLRLAVGYDRGLALFGETALAQASPGGIVAAPTRGIPTDALFQALRIDAGAELGRNLSIDLQTWAAERIAPILDGERERERERERPLFGRLTVRWRFEAGVTVYAAAEVLGQEERGAEPSSLWSRRYLVGVTLDSTRSFERAARPPVLGSGISEQPGSVAHGGVRR